MESCIVCYEDFETNFKQLRKGFHCPTCRTFVCEGCSIKTMKHMEMTERDNFACCPVCRRKNWKFFFRIGCLGEFMNNVNRAIFLVEIFLPLQNAYDYDERFNEIKIIDERYVYWGKPGNGKLVKDEFEGATPIMLWERQPGIFASIVLEKIDLPKIGLQVPSKDCYYRVSVDEHMDYNKFESINPLQKQFFSGLAYYFTPKLPKIAIDRLMSIVIAQQTEAENK